MLFNLNIKFVLNLCLELSLLKKVLYKNFLNKKKI